MSATDELRRLLDERGVEWGTNETLTDCWTRWDAGKFRCTATEINGTFAFSVGNSTPEQAIAVTLGRESYGKDAEQGERADTGERESYATLKTENEQLRELLSDMWTFTRLVDISGRLSSGGVWNATEFEKRMRELGVIE